MKISKILMVGVFFLIFSILSLGAPSNADAAYEFYVKIKGTKQQRTTSNSYVLSGPDAEKVMKEINALKKDCCSCRKVGNEIICTGKGSSDCCDEMFKSLRTTKPTKP